MELLERIKKTKQLLYNHASIPCEVANHLVQYLFKEVREITQIMYNYLLINKYTHEGHNIQPHKDDEDGWDQSAPLLVLVLFEDKNGSRYIRVEDGKGIAHDINLKHGHGLTFEGDANKHLKHSVRPIRQGGEDKVICRISLTFRKYDKIPVKTQYPIKRFDVPILKMRNNKTTL